MERAGAGSGTGRGGFVIKLSSETIHKLQEQQEQPGPPCTLAADGDKRESTEDVRDSDSTAQSRHTTNSDEVTEGDAADAPVTPAALATPAIAADETPREEQPGSRSAWGEYAPHVTYEGETAVYIDPATELQYVWSADTSAWIPRNPEAARPDPDKVYSYENDTHVYTETDGSKFFWDEEKKAWFPKVDDDFLAHYQMAYGFVDNTTKESTKSEPPPKKVPDSGPPKRKLPEDPKWFDASEENNTKVYVSNLPLDMTEEEFVNLMQKCGLVMRDLNSQKMKVKLYFDKEYNCFKGDALCTYIKIESVELALNLLDGSDVRGNKISVQKAHFQMKGDYNPALKPKKKKKKELEKIKKMQQKLFDWRPEKAVGERSKNERVVIVKNLFDPTDFDKEVQLILDYQQDLREECSKCGEVRKIVLYDRHPEGVAQITMKEPEQADAVIQLINNRWFGKRKLTAEIWDGRTKYRIAETEADINKRVGKWEQFLEGGDTKNKTKDEGDPSAETVKEVSNDAEHIFETDEVTTDAADVTIKTDEAKTVPDVIIETDIMRTDAADKINDVKVVKIDAPET